MSKWQSTLRQVYKHLEQGWSDEEAEAEWEGLFTEEEKEDRAVLCDVCYKVVMGTAP